jgi:N-acyl-D-amino-acid deacylase
MLSLLVLCLTALQAQDFDLILRGGRVVDGTGNPWYRADVAIKDGRIAAIGNLAQRSARRTISLKGEIVAPGFIDMMGASSLPLLSDPASGDSKVRQGITTILAGEGSSPAPRCAADGQTRGETWSNYDTYHPLLEKRGLAVNVVHNVGAAQVRRCVIGDKDQVPTTEQLEAMKKLVDDAMRAGAVGLSTALIYPPGTYAKTAELVELNKVVAKYGGFYSTHMRNESSQLLEAIAESIEIGEKAGVPVHIYHLKAAGEENWPLMAKAVALIEAARSRGLDVTADIYPYIRNGLGIAALIPPHHFAQGSAPFLATLKDPAVRAKLRDEIESKKNWENWYQHVGRNWDNILVASMSAAADKPLEGKSVAEVARVWSKSEWDTFFDLVLRGASVNPKSMNEEQKHLAMRTEWISFCTDAPPTNILTATGAHPRAFGSFPRVLAKYVREEKVISLETAIRKMTSLAANRLQIYDRGRIAAGLAADIVVFDADKVQDTATFTKPLSFPEGIGYVSVNGGVVVDEGKTTANKPGRVLRLRKP